MYRNSMHTRPYSLVLTQTHEEQQDHCYEPEENEMLRHSEKIELN